MANGFRFLHWPTEYTRITQVYNNNPGYYGRWGLTGHEGVDIQAPVGSRVFAVAPGRVVHIVNASENRPYGNAVYLQHADGYRTAYAHLNRVGVAVGQEVGAGHILGEAGETGNAFGAHLHLTLYKEGASERGETRQPRDIVDPTPFLDPLLHAAWEAPDPPLVSGWGWADSIERREGLGRVAHSSGVNLRAQPRRDAAPKGLLPRGSIVRVTGSLRNNYFPVEAAAADVERQPEGGEGADALGYKFVGFEGSLGDFTNVQPGRQFTATWTLRNSGTRSWDDDFRLSYVEAAAPETDGVASSRLGAEASYRLQELAGRGPVGAGETVRIPLTLVAPQQPGWYASHWQLQTETGKPVGSPVWLRLNVRGARPEPAPTGDFQPGMNINPDAHALDVERLRGLDWVRFVYKAAAKHRTVDEAFRDQYQALIQAYANAGIRCLIIINQETEWGNSPWDGSGSWARYAGMLARAAGRIAELCAPFGEMIAYQIWNEGDSGPENPSAISVSAEDFAPVLFQTARAIRQADPDVTIVFGGLNTAPHNAVAYARKVREELRGELPVNALAYHPYGRYVHNDPFYNEQFGTLQDALAVFKNAFPDLPLWITEIGIASDSPIGSEHYEKIANYMREIVTEIDEKHKDQVPVLVWFAWSDLMRNAGLTTVGGEMKPHLGEAYREMIARGKADNADERPPPDGEGEPKSEFVRFTTTLEDHSAVPVGTAFTNRWYFRNTGDATWGDGYRLEYAPQGEGPHPMLSQTSFPLSEVADPGAGKPGQEVEITMAMTAPEPAGRLFRSRWELRNPDGVPFGSLYAQITTVPASSVGSGAGHADMVFVADHTVPDDTRFAEGETFRKQWRVRNTGDRQWGDGFRLVFVEGNLPMARGVASHMIPAARKGEEVILTVPMVTPLAQNGQPTTYQSLWRLQDDLGNFFGRPVWVRIIALPAAGSTGLGRFGDPAGWYSQLDPRWQSEPLGHGQQNIGSWGCLLVCQAMLLTACGLPITPEELNERLRMLGAAGFKGSNVQFKAPTLLLADLEHGRNLRSWPTPAIPWTEWVDGDPIARIDQALAAGHAVFAQVDRAPNNAFYHSNTEQHWVILISRTPEGDDYLMLDPMTSPDQLHSQPGSLMLKYGNPASSRPHEQNLRNAIKSALVYRCNN